MEMALDNGFVRLGMERGGRPARPGAKSVWVEGRIAFPAPSTAVGRTKLSMSTGELSEMSGLSAYKHQTIHVSRGHHTLVFVSCHSLG